MPFDLTTIPTTALRAELRRRATGATGRPRKLIPCPKCGTERSRREWWSKCACGYALPRAAKKGGAV